MADGKLTVFDYRTKWTSAARRGYIMAMPRRLAAFATVLVLGLSCATARADTPEQGRALELFDQSEVAYQRGQFDEAARLLREAYALQKEPVLLYNLARAYEGLGDLASAAKAYEDFLAAQPGAKDEGAITRRIATLRRQLAEREAEKKRASAPRPVERRPSAAPWIVAGFGVLGVGTGVAFTFFSRSKHDAAVAEPVQTTASHDQDVAKTDASIALASYIAGGAVAAAGIAWGIFDLRASRATPRVAVIPTVGGGCITGRF